MALVGANLSYVGTRPSTPEPVLEPVAPLPVAAGSTLDIPVTGWDHVERPVAANHEPVEWLESRGYECRDYQGREVCEGPRRVPRPLGEPAKLAKKLGLGTRQAARTALQYYPPREWRDAVQGDSTDAFHWPVRGGKLWRGVTATHRGVDVGGPVGSHIFAVSDGLVVYSDNEVPGYGNIAVVVHPDFRVAMYAHCRSVWVFAGQQVKIGQIIAEVGETGITRGAHLHFELRHHGDVVDPLPMMKRWQAFNEMPAALDGGSAQVDGGSVGGDGGSAEIEAADGGSAEVDGGM